jgi:hypothetical protein
MILRVSACNDGALTGDHEPYDSTGMNICSDDGVIIQYVDP